MKPLGDYILINKRKESEKTLASGIILTNEVDVEGASEGIIEALGPDVEGLTIGQKVIFNEHQFDRLQAFGTYDILVGKKTSIYATYAD